MGSYDEAGARADVVDGLLRRAFGGPKREGKKLFGLARPDGDALPGS